MDKLKRFFTQHREATVFVLLLFLALLLLSVQSASVVKRSKTAGYSVISVVQLGASRVGTFFSDTFNSIAELRKLRTEYEQLRKKIDEYKNIERDIVDLKRENERLRELLGFSEKIDIPHVAARIIAKDTNPMFGGLTINKGSRSGIEKDQAVITYTDGFQGLVGRIVETGPHTAKILPIINSSSYVAARMRESRYEGLIQGEGRKTEMVRMGYVKKRAKESISFGDLVVTSGLNSVYPEGLYLGRVRSFEAPEWETSLTLSVEPVVDFSKLEYVFVLETEEKAAVGTQARGGRP